MAGVLVAGFAMTSCSPEDVTGANGNIPQASDYTCLLYTSLVAGRTDLMYVGVYNGIYLVGKKNGEWQVVGKIEGMNDSCRLFEQESDKVIWVYNTDVYKRQPLLRLYRP